MPPPPLDAVVLGGGISGLVAAYDLARGGASVTVVEASDRLGGKLRTEEFAGARVDVGADMVLTRVPEVTDLAADLGLDLRMPATLAARVLARGELRPLPGGTVLGVPTSLGALRGLLSPVELARAARDRVRPRPPLDGDASVAEVVGSRLGPAVVDRLVEPLLGGVYAGRADELSVRATLPQVAEAAARGGPLLRALAPPEPAADGTAAFASVAGGLGGLAKALGRRLFRAGVQLCVESRAATLERLGRGWRVTLAGGRALVTDAVVVAVPAPEAARLLRTVAPDAAAALAAIGYADVATVTLAYDPGTPLPEGSGILVPASAGRSVKGVTFTSRKWGHDPAGPVILRCSIGRAGEPPPADDGTVAGAAARDLSELLGLGPPLDVLVTRWPLALPQYAVRHLDRVDAVEAALRVYPTIAVAGAAYGGVGVPACVRSGHAAAARLLGARMGA